MFTAEEESNLQNNFPIRAALARESGRCLNRSWKVVFAYQGRALNPVEHGAAARSAAHLLGIDV